MEEKQLKGSFYDDDILKAIEDISFINENYTKCREVKRDLETEVAYRIRVIEELKNSEKQLIEGHTSSKKLIAEQQFTISKLVTIKDEIKIYKEEVSKRDERIKQLEEDFFRLTSNYAQEKSNVQDCHNLKEREIVKQYEQRIQTLKEEMNVLILEADCNLRESNEDLLRVKAEMEEQTNVLVLDYEEQLQRVYAESVQMRDEMQEYMKRTNANISVYQKRIEELEQMHHQRKNTVILNNVPVKSEPATFTPGVKRKNTDEYQPARTQTISKVKNEEGNPSTHTVPHKLVYKQNNVRRVFKPLQIQITPSTSGILPINQKRLSPVGGGSAMKGSKRKLFTKNNDEFQDFEEE